MPEKPKRRKNNKNKRKNKNFRIDPNSNNSQSNDEGCSQTLEKKDIVETNQHDSHEEKKEFEHNLLENSKTIADTCNDIEKVIENEQSGETNSEQVIIEHKEFHEHIEHREDFKSENHSVELSDSTENIKNNTLISNMYVVETPDQVNNKKPKLANGKKSKSVDDDDLPKIIEITEENSTLSENDKTITTTENTGLVLDVDLDIEWEKATDLEYHNLPKIEELVTGTLSVTTIPLTVAHCEQAKLLTLEEEQSLRRYLQTLNLATNPSTSIEIKSEIEQIINSEIKHRLRKKGLADDILSQRLCPPRMLDVIDEEGSGESSMQSRRHSYLSDKKSDNDDLDDEVFEQSVNQSTLKKKYDTQWDSILRKNPLSQQITQKCVLVGAKLKEPEISEARGNWTVQTVEKMTGAEVVYLTDSSSSTSSIYDVGEDESSNEQDTDVSVRMITPTIEVTDTENFLKKTFISENKDSSITSEQKSLNNYITESKEFCSTSNENKHVLDDIEQRLHEVVVLTTDNIETNLTVKDMDDTEKPQDTLDSVENTTIKLDSSSMQSPQRENKMNSSKCGQDYDLEMKVLKCELNDAINNLIKEVSDSESISDNSKDILTRQDSSSSLSSSQCTAIYNPNSSLNDISNNDEYQTTKESKDYSKESITVSHVQDVLECIDKNSLQNITLDQEVRQPQKLRDICVKKISSFPYGLKILEELANVSLRLQNINSLGSEYDKQINECTSNRKNIKLNTDCVQLSTTFNRTSNRLKESIPQNKNLEGTYPPPVPPPPIPPPPVIPRNSSLKKSQDIQPADITSIETPYVCLSPSQKMLMEKTNTVVTTENVSQVDVSKNNVNYTHDKNTEQVGKPFTTPLKSQTGSRLMALICDPAITSNINSSLNKFGDKQLQSIQKMKIEPIKSIRKYSDHDNQAVKFSSVNNKPIPPPRPKKLLSSFYESDENSDFAESSFKCMKREKKVFHFSTGNLSKEIEDDISTIQNMHRNYINVKNQHNELKSPRRPSLPKDLCEQQMEYIRQKEKEVEAEIRRLESEKFRPIVKKGPRAPMIIEKEINKDTLRSPNLKPSTKGTIWNTNTSDKGKKDKFSSVFSGSQEELLREKMYSEYLNEIAEREQRKHHKVIKITNTPQSDIRLISKSMSALDVLDSRVNNRIEEEFISKARERWNKLGIRDPESEDERNIKSNVYREPKVIEHKIKVIEAGEEKDVNRLPNHLQEFVTFTADKRQETGSTGESESEEKSAHVVVLCAVMLLVLAIGRYLLRLLRNI